MLYQLISPTNKVAKNQITEVYMKSPNAFPMVAPVNWLTLIEAPMHPNRKGRQNHIIHFK